MFTAQSGMFIPETQGLVFDVDAFGANISLSDNSTAIGKAIAAAGVVGGGFVVLSAMYPVAHQLSLTLPGVHLVGLGPGTGLKPSSSFPDGKVINITADFCGVRDMQIAYTNTNSASNPAATAINISQARYSRIHNVEFFYIGGWAIQSIGSTGKSNLGCVISNVHMLHCQSGIHLQAKQTNWPTQHFLSNINTELIDSGDALFIEDCDDIVLDNMLGAVSGTGTGSVLHIKGAGASNFFSNLDIGSFPAPTGATPTVLIESGLNGSPSNLTLQGGVIQQGSIGVQITAGKQITIKGFKIGGNAGNGIDISGTTTFDVKIEQNTFVLNGVTAGANRYSVNNSSTGDVYIRNNTFQDNIGSSANQVNGLINSSAGAVTVVNNAYTGTGVTPANTTIISGGTMTTGRVLPFTLFDGELASTSSAVGVANTAYLVGVKLDEFGLLSGIRVSFNTVGGSGHYDVGIYDAIGTNNAPVNLLAHAASSNTALSTSAVVLTPSLIGGNIWLPPGRYWLALWIDNATDTIRRVSGNTGLPVVMSGTNAGPLPALASSLASLGNANFKPLLEGIFSGSWS